MKMKICSIMEFARWTDEEKGWTEAFRQAVAFLEKQGGGVLEVPSGEYRTCSIFLKSHMELHLEKGAVLRFIDEPEKYEITDVEFEGVMGTMYMPCIYAKESEDISITGEGVIDGQGMRWWKEKNMLPHKRPYLICMERCRHVKLEGVRLTQSPAWTVHPVYCEDVWIHGITIKNPADSPNTDGIDPDCCKNVRISDCLIDVGDDCIAIKAGTEDTKEVMPCENIVITNCNMVHGHGGIVIGSEMSGGVRNVAVSNCVFQDTDRGIRLKTRRRRGGAMERLSFQNIIMDRVICPFTFNMYYYCGAAGKERHVWEKVPYPVDETTPQVQDILINNVMVFDAQAAAGFFYGLPEAPIRRVTISNTRIIMDPNGKPGHTAMMGQLEPMKGEGFYLRYVKDLVLNQVFVEQAVETVNQDETVEFVWN